MFRVRTSRSVLCATLALVGGCSDPEPPAPTPETLARAAGVTPKAMAPRVGGQAILAGPRVVEVVSKANGEIVADVRDAEGEAIVGARVEVRVPDEGGTLHPVILRYDRRAHLYEGSAPEGLSPARGRVEVTVHPRGGEPTVGEVASMSPAPPAEHGGQVVMVGPYAPEVQVLAGGQVVVHVPTEDGELPDGDLYVHVPVGEEEPRRLELEFDDEMHAYVAHVDEGVVVSPGRVALELELDDRTHRGGVEIHAVAPAPSLGGDIVVTGDYSVEVVEAGGEVRAAVYDVHGHALERRPQTVQVRVEGRPRPMTLRWNATLGVYAAPLPPEVHLAAAPLEIEVRHRGRRHRGRVRYHHRGPMRGHGTGMGPHDHPPGWNAGVRVEVRGMTPHPPHPPVSGGSIRVEHSVSVHASMSGMGRGGHGYMRGHGMGSMGGMRRGRASMMRRRGW